MGGNLASHSGFAPLYAMFSDLIQIATFSDLEQRLTAVEELFASPHGNSGADQARNPM
jgi:hypothetical protein